MAQYIFKDKSVVLQSQKSNIVVSGILFCFSFLSFLLPLAGILFGLSSGKGLHVGYFIWLILFGVIGFYLLRIALWNTYGRELIQIEENKISYLANYGWFKDGRKSLPLDLVTYEIRPIGSEGDQKGVLVIKGEEKVIQSVVILSRADIESIIDFLKQKKST